MKKITKTPPSELGAILSAIESIKPKKKKEKTRNPNPQARRWIFTLYPEQLDDEFFEFENPYKANKEEKEEKTTDIEIAKSLNHEVLESLLYYGTGARGLAYSVEAGDSKEHLHIQGYIEFATPIRFKRLKNLIGFGVHLETANGNRSDNFDYLFHTGEHTDKGKLYDTKKIGEWPDTSGSERGCYDEAVAMVLDGYSITTIARSYGGSVLTQVGNLVRLKNEVDQDRGRYIRAGRELETILREQREYAETPF